MVKIVISGGQTGADRIGLEVAHSLRIPTGGWAPKDYRTEDGNDESLHTVFGLEETQMSGYTHRTLLNVRESDGTVLFGDMSSSGSQQTIRFCDTLQKPYICNPTPEGMVNWLATNHIQTLNVAGNRGSKLNTAKREEIRTIITQALSNQISA